MQQQKRKQPHNQNPTWNNKEFLSILLKMIELIER